MDRFFGGPFILKLTPKTPSPVLSPTSILPSNGIEASIPLLGKILVGDKTGEGVFGVSFKIKGPPKNLSTTVNPIKTLTPRFITRTLEKIKKN